MPNYKFYATLLDAFKWYQKSESENAEQEFIDKINRVPITDEKALERMNKGTALNNLVDSIVLNGYDKLYPEVTKFDGFEFKTDVVIEIAEYLKSSISQYKTSMLIDVKGSVVELYGYIDYIDANKAIDLKSTASYDLGKYKDSMQMHVYPLSLNHEGVDVDEFEFVVTDFKTVFKEPYTVDLKESNRILTEQCSLLIDFLELKKHLITDKKIFGLENVAIAEYDHEVNSTIIQ